MSGDRTRPTTDAELIAQTIGPRPPALPNPRVPIAALPRPQEPGVISADQFGWPDLATGVAHVLSVLGNGAADFGSKSLQGAGMAARDAGNSVVDYLAQSPTSPLGNALGQVRRNLGNTEADLGALSRDTAQADSNAAEDATSRALDFLYGKDRNTHLTNAQNEDVRSASVANSQQAIIDGINRIGHYEDMQTPEQIRAAMFPDRGDGYDRRTIPEQTQANVHNVEEQKRLAAEALAGRDPRAVRKDLGDVVTFPFDLANQALDNAALGRPADAPGSMDPTIEALAQNEHRTHRTQAVTDYTGRNEEQQPAKDVVTALAPGDHIATIPTSSDPGMESDITTPLQEGGPQVPPGPQAKQMLSEDPGALLRLLHQALVPMPRPKPDVPETQPQHPIPPLTLDNPPTPRHKPVVPTRAPVASPNDGAYDPRDAPYSGPAPRPRHVDNGSVPDAATIPTPSATIMRGADQRISGMKLGDKLISFERGPDGRISNIHIFQGR